MRRGQGTRRQSTADDLVRAWQRWRCDRLGSIPGRLTGSRSTVILTEHRKGLAMTASTRNVLQTLRAALQTTDDQTMIMWRHWYRRARRLAVELDPTDPARAAAVIAVLSPRTSWPLNVRLARLAYALHAYGETTDAVARTLPTLRDHARKAQMILDGGDPAKIVSGPKVTAFWQTITDPTLATAVVVDRHAIDVAFGRTTDNRTRAPFLTARRYGEAAAKYARAAKIISRETGETWLPSEVQAVTWSYWRITSAQANHGDLAA